METLLYCQMEEQGTLTVWMLLISPVPQEWLIFARRIINLLWKEEDSVGWQWLWAAVILLS